MADTDEEFIHDLLIANTDGRIFHIKHEVWANEDHAVDNEEFETHEGWQLVRNMLESGATLVAVPPESKLPPGTPRLLGTCYIVNIEGLKQSHKFHQRTRRS